MLIGVGASTCASGSQVWNGKDGSLTMKPMKKQDEHPPLDRPRVIAGFTGDRRELDNVERMARETGHRHAALPEIEDQDCYQDEYGSKQRVEQELDRCVLSPRSSPDCDQEVHRQEHHLEEDVKQEQVE